MFCSYSLDFTATLHYQVLRSVYIMQEMFLFLQCFNQSEVTVSAGLCRAAGGDAPNSGSNTDCHRTAPPIDEDNHANIIINDKNPKDVRL